MNKLAKILITGALFLPFLVASAQTAPNVDIPLDEAMLKYKDACLTERKAAKDKNQVAMMKAHKLFKGIKTGPFKYSVVSETPKGALGKPVMEFTPEYCEHLIKNQYSIVPLDTLGAMRDVPRLSQLLTDNFSLQPNSAVTISIRARGNCAMLVISEDDMPLNISSEIDGEPLVFNSEEGGTVNWSTWTLPKTFREVEFTISNPNDRQVSFAIAVQ